MKNDIIVIANTEPMPNFVRNYYRSFPFFVANYITSVVIQPPCAFLQLLKYHMKATRRLLQEIKELMFRLPLANTAQPPPPTHSGQTFFRSLLEMLLLPLLSNCSCLCKNKVFQIKQCVLWSESPNTRLCAVTMEIVLYFDFKRYSFKKAFPWGLYPWLVPTVALLLFT